MENGAKGCEVCQDFFFPLSVGVFLFGINFNLLKSSLRS